MAGFQDSTVPAPAVDVRHIPKFGGELWFVSAGNGDNSYSGTSPDEAFATIGKAISECSAGDAITIMAGTYVENVVVNKAGVELWCEIGTVFDGAGTCLTISEANIKLNNANGSCKVTPATDQVGVNVTGENFHAQNVRVHGAADAGNSWNLAGGGAILHECRASGIKTGNKAFNITTSGNKLYDCSTVGSTTSYGYYLSGSISKGLLVGCTSAGHQTSGFYIATAVSAYTLLNCSSGNGDGKWRDIDNANVWSNFSYDSELFSTLTFPAAAGSENLFEIFGSVNIFYIYGHVTEAIHADVDNLKLELYDGSASDITGNVDTDSAPNGSLFMKTKVRAIALSLNSGAAASINEDSTGIRGGFGIPFVLTAKNADNTYIRATWSGAAGAGVTGIIHWHIQYEALTDEGFVKAV